MTWPDWIWYASLRGCLFPAGDSPAGRFSAQPLPGVRSCSVGKDAAGCPALLIQTEAAGPRAPVGPIVLENLSVLHNGDCRMQNVDGEATTHRLSVIRCCGEDSALHEYFLRALSPVISSLPARPTREQVAEAVNTLVELFSPGVTGPAKDLQGLWAELFVIQRAADPAALLRAWHVEPEDRFDFTDDSQRIEVKTASGRARIHGFSHE